MTHKIKTFEGACKALKIKANLPVVTGIPKRHQKAIVANYKLTIIAEALNEGWKPDWSDRGQYKYYAWFEVKTTPKNKSGVGFSGTLYSYAGTSTAVGSRLCFRTSDLALYAAKQFKRLYKDYLLLEK